MALRIILGNHPTSNLPGLWISKPGADALSTNPEDFLFDPTRYAMRSYMKGVIGLMPRVTNADTTENIGGSLYYTGTFTLPVITHGLGYIPIFFINGRRDLRFGVKSDNMSSFNASFRDYYKRVTGGVTTYYTTERAYYDLATDRANPQPSTTYTIMTKRWI